MFTPRTPRPFFLLLALGAGLSIANLGKAQDVKLLPLSVYETSLVTFHAQKVKTACLEYQASTKKKWWYYLPTLGYSFGLPSVNGGTNQLIQLDQTRQQNWAKLEAITSQAQLDYRTELHQLRSLYQALEIEQATIADSYTTEQMEKRIFSISAEAHDKKEIKPVEFHQAQLLYQRQVTGHEQQRRSYRLRIVELARFARYNFPEETLPGLDSLRSMTVNLSTPRSQH
ncbi:hypothetical protein M0L20_28595 [Spirosoma sp. RP8]|uniref:DUF4294 domain-containing protein n=1 Tax=Spirosoma liriopis TaxID=2937440 RepID=A0ABT0HUI8_9BACT|nr:hypothetical protein [Spirosoma liriopis]MCK8495859.1 hypothetical protein [Spirosoma liriopis]